MADSPILLYTTFSSMQNFLLCFQLAHYLDVAEGSLAQQISTKSGDFFDAMRSQETLQTEVQSSCGEVQVLR